jgi:hypothetical protein
MRYQLDSEAVGVHSAGHAGQTIHVRQLFSGSPQRPEVHDRISAAIVSSAASWSLGATFAAENQG